MKVIILFLFLALTCQAEPLPTNFLYAINQVETHGKTGAILGDDGKALGPFQIHKECWQDSGVEGKYEQCADYKYSVKVITSYLNRFAKNAVKNNNFEIMARRWNGGPMGDKKDATLNYWRKVQKHLKR